MNAYGIQSDGGAGVPHSLLRGDLSGNLHLLAGAEDGYREPLPGVCQ